MGPQSTAGWVRLGRTWRASVIGPKWGSESSRCSRETAGIMARRRDRTESVAVVLGRENYSGDCRAWLGPHGPTHKVSISRVRQTGNPLFRQTARVMAGWQRLLWGL